MKMVKVRSNIGCPLDIDRRRAKLLMIFGTGSCRRRRYDWSSDLQRVCADRSLDARLSSAMPYIPSIAIVAYFRTYPANGVRVLGDLLSAACGFSFSNSTRHVAIRFSTGGHTDNCDRFVSANHQWLISCLIGFLYLVSHV